MELRDRLILALDVDDLVLALRLADQLRPWFGVAKVGLELFTAAGPDAVTSVADAGFKVFLDLKLHDIPTTVKKSARVAGALGASYLTLHARAGAVMLRAGVDGLKEGAAAGGLPEPTALAVTILTSDADAPEHILGGRVAAAVESGCGGVIVAAADVHEAKQLAPRLLAVVPGIRLPSGDPHDQARAATPRDAFLVGADMLVIGRAVTEAADPPAAAAALHAAIVGGSGGS
ncbi:MAG: orotidine-5-phosphate decarboxylase [Actinomycetota bacterium]|jgi:orotidine-5'-phosphate decarboxylase|nr:orotidine-5-phosphate decarboxylase [Actinomycetota bacterium]MEA2972089.1 orotidine-5-phosphate decarboxylase [Actinomycetota bacterium]